MKILKGLPVLFLLLDGCIDPLPVGRVANVEALVVDGVVTDGTGPHAVNLFMSGGLSEEPSAPEPVRGASLSIIDDAGQVYPLTETQPGIYTTNPSEFQGFIGRSYWLRIVTQDGEEYHSTVETLVPAGEIDSLYAVFEENVINQTDITQPQDAITFYVDGTSAPENTDGMQRWRSSSISEILTFPELRTKKMNDEVVPDPLPCSGYINSNGTLKAVDTCSCCNCWVYDYSRNAVVSPAASANQNRFRDVAVARIPVDSWRFFRKFYFEVEQLSISENVYEFWKRVSAQQQGTGSLFQPNAVKVKGNIKCVSDPDKEVFGVFSATSITKKSMFLTRGQLPKQIAQPEQITFDCRYVMDNSTNIKPPFW